MNSNDIWNEAVREARQMAEKSCLCQRCGTFPVAYSVCETCIAELWAEQKKWEQQEWEAEQEAEEAVPLQDLWHY